MSETTKDTKERDTPNPNDHERVQFQISNLRFKIRSIMHGSDRSAIEPLDPFSRYKRQGASPKIFGRSTCPFTLVDPKQKCAQHNTKSTDSSTILTSLLSTSGRAPFPK